MQAVEALQAEVARLSAIVSKLERSTVKAPAPDSDDDINFKRVQHIALQIFSGPHKDKDIAPGMDEPGKADCHAYYGDDPPHTCWGCLAGAGCCDCGPIAALSCGHFALRTSQLVCRTPRTTWQRVFSLSGRPSSLQR